MAIWVSVNGSHSSRLNLTKESESFPIFGDRPCETRIMRADRWSMEHKELARKQHAFLQYEAHRIFSEALQNVKSEDSPKPVIQKICLGLEQLFNPLLAELLILRATFNVIHNGVGYEAHVSYSISTGPTILHLTNLTPSEYESLVE